MFGLHTLHSTFSLMTFVVFRDFTPSRMKFRTDVSRQPA